MPVAKQSGCPPPYLLSKLSWGSWERPSFTPEWGPPSFLLSQGPTHITSSPGRCWRWLCFACSFPRGSLGPRSLHCPELMACVLCLPPPPLVHFSQIPLCFLEEFSLFQAGTIFSGRTGYMPSSRAVWIATKARGRHSGNPLLSPTQRLAKF